MLWARSWSWGEDADGSELVGTFEGTKTAIARTGPTRVARIALNGGQPPVDLWLNPASLQNGWQRLDPKPGDRLRIRRAPEMQRARSGRWFWPFEIERIEP